MKRSLKASTRLAIWACALAAMPAGAVLTAGDAGARCLPRYVTQYAIRGANRRFAQNLSQVRWEEQVKKRFGTAYARWKLAAGQQFHCRRPAPNRAWRCMASARPCRAAYERPRNTKSHHGKATQPGYRHRLKYRKKRE